MSMQETNSFPRIEFLNQQNWCADCSGEYVVSFQNWIEDYNDFRFSSLQARQDLYRFYDAA